MLFITDGVELKLLIPENFRRFETILSVNRILKSVPMADPIRLTMVKRKANILRKTNEVSPKVLKIAKSFCSACRTLLPVKITTIKINKATTRNMNRIRSFIAARIPSKPDHVFL